MLTLASCKQNIGSSFINKRIASPFWRFEKNIEDWLVFRNKWHYLAVDVDVDDDTVEVVVGCVDVDLVAADVDAVDVDVVSVDVDAVVGGTVDVGAVELKKDVVQH